MALNPAWSFMPVNQEVTALLKEINKGDNEAPEKLLPLVYDELRKLAQGYMQNERPDHTKKRRRESRLRSAS